MVRKTICAALLAGCVVITGCGWWGGSSSKKESNYQTSSKSKKSGPSVAPRSVRGADGSNLFRLPMSDGQAVTVKSPAVLFFFTSWCGYCKQVMPEFKALAQRARNQGWRVYGIDVGEGPAKVNQVIQQYQPNFPVLLDQQSLVARQYRIEGYPTFIVVDEGGNITYDSHDLPNMF